MHGGGGDCSGGFCDIGSSFGAGHGFDAGHSHGCHVDAGTSHASHMDSSFVPVFYDSASSGATGTHVSKSGTSGNTLVKIASVGFGGLMALDGWRRLSASKSDDQQQSSLSWAGTLETVGGVSLMAYGLLR